MTLKEEYFALRDAFVAAKNSPLEQQAIEDRINKLIEEHPDEFPDVLEASVDDLIEKATSNLVKSQMEPIIPMINLSYIAKTYFKKSNAWFIQRVNGYIVNGKRATFKEEDLKTLQDALSDMADKLKSIKLI